MNNDEIRISERIGVLDAKISAAHSRVDKIEELIKADLTEVKNDLKVVVAWMNRSLGWAAALLFVGGLFGAVLSKIIK